MVSFIKLAESHQKMGEQMIKAVLLLHNLPVIEVVAVLDFMITQRPELKAEPSDPTQTPKDRATYLIDR